MPKLTTDDIENIISNETGYPQHAIKSFLVALSSLAYKEAINGFCLPGFGEFSIYTHPDKKMTNPFTNEEIVIRGEREIQFNFDTTAVDSFLKNPLEDIDKCDEHSPEVNKLPEIRLVPNKNDVKAAGLNPDWVIKTTRNKLGGAPDWLQGEECPRCCGKEMQFYGQFDSIIGSNFNLVDSGMLYVFWCKHCNQAKTVLQYC